MRFLPVNSRDFDASPPYNGAALASAIEFANAFVAVDILDVVEIVETNAKGAFFPGPQLSYGNSFHLVNETSESV